MRIRRGLLFWGLFLIPLGAIPLLVRAGALDADTMVDAWRLWPLVLVALGLALILGRYRAGLVGVALAAVMLGSIAGGAIASGNVWFGSISQCVESADDMVALDEQGTFGGPATLTIDLDCGSADVTTAPGIDWQVHAEHLGPPPVIQPSGTGLTVRAPEQADSRRQEWTITAGTEQLRTIDFRGNAGASTFRLDGANLDRLDIDTNATDVLIDAGSATVGRLDVSGNATRIRLTLGSGATTGVLSMNAGAVDLCVPAGAALRLDVDDQLTLTHNLESRGLTQDGETWTRPGSGDPIELAVDGNAASFTLDPDGGCR